MKKIRMMMAAALAILASCSTTKSGESTANPLSSKVIVAYVLLGSTDSRVQE